MSAELPLIKTREFQCAVGIPVTIAVLLAVSLVVFDDSLGGLQWDAEGFNTFLSMFRLPIGVLAAAIPLGALAASNHRSHQAAQTIKAQQAQNELTNYFEHLERFESFAASLGDATYPDLVDAREVHSSLYPSAMHGIFHVSFDFSYRIEKLTAATDRLQTVMADLPNLQGHDSLQPPSNHALARLINNQDPDTVPDYAAGLVWLLEACKRGEVRGDSVDQITIKVPMIATGLSNLGRFERSHDSIMLHKVCKNLEESSLALMRTQTKLNLLFNCSLKGLLDSPEGTYVAGPKHSYVFGGAVP
ncbi:MAG: hypothetical protein AAGI11_04365 [Pseudomonadota bacterium]